MNKKNLSESDICDKFIRPAMVQAGWNGMDQIYSEYPLRAGRVMVRGNKSHRAKDTVLRADFALFFKANIPIAAVEAKDNNHAMGAGMAQAINYAELLDVPFCFSSNGDGFVFRDATMADGMLEKTITLDEFPSPHDLWERYCTWKGWTPAVRQITEFDYAPSKTPRYYQLNAINRTVEAIAQGQNRAMLVMTTGTGKTYTAFQIIWRLWKSGAKKRILFLADRNILIDQTMVNDFRPFKGAMAKLSPNAKGVERVDAQGQITIEDVDLAVNKTTKLVDKSYEIYLSLYQAVTGTEEERNIYKQFSPDFFDLIVVDECHRGSANEDSAWREILTYFSSAAHVGLIVYDGKHVIAGSSPNFRKQPKTVRGPLVDQIDTTVNLVMDILADGVVHSGSGFKTLHVYPERVVKEAIVNAIIHRDYRLNRDIFIRIFDDRIEVESPGVFPGNITPANIARMGTRARNPLLSANLREFPVAPNIDAGEGVKMMFSEMAQAELYPPQYRQSTDLAVESVTVSLFNAKRPSAWDEVSDWLDRHGSITNADVVQISNLDTLKASKLLTSWRDQGLLAPVPGRGKRNMAYSKPTGGGQHELGLLSEEEDNNAEKE